MAPTMMSKLFSSLAICIALILFIATPISAFSPKSPLTSPPKSLHARSKTRYRKTPPLASSPEDNNNNLGVIDLTDDDDDDVPGTAVVAAESSNDATASPAAPFLSQGELSDDPNLLSPDFKDAKQTRVIFYIILTLVPVLFLVPLMLGSRDLIPLDALPPVEMN